MHCTGSPRWRPGTLRPEMRALSDTHRPSGERCNQASERAQPHRGAGGPWGRTGVGAGQETLAASGEDRRQMGVRPVVASPAYNPLLLPNRHGRRHVVDPVPRPAGRRLVSAERMMATGYVELHARSFYSFGVGASHTHELLAQAKEHSYFALALTDTNLCGALEFARLANSLDIQPITGGRADSERRITTCPAGRDTGGLLQHLQALHHRQRRRPQGTEARPLLSTTPC